MTIFPVSLSRLGRVGVRLAAVVSVLFVSVLGYQLFAGPVTYSGFGPEEARIVRSAISRFDTARLELPFTHVRRANFGERCQPRGQATNSWPVKVAQICAVLEEVVVHELAHAWTFVHLSESNRHEFALRRGTPTWRSREHPWMDRASEHAADILTWYLYWSREDGPEARIAGEVSVEAYLSDLSWLVATADLPDASEILAARASELAPMWVATQSQ